MALPADDYYALLGVDAAADDGALHRAWRALAARWHPDRAGPGATATFQRLSAAYEVLSDPVKRMAYDRRRRAAGAPTPTPRPEAVPNRPPAPAVMLSRLSRPFHILLISGAARYDEVGFITLVLRQDEAAQGGMVSIAMRVDVWCPVCKGAERAASCGRCLGRRSIEELFTAWLSVPPGVADGEVLAPSEELSGVVEPVRFRVRVARLPH